MKIIRLKKNKRSLVINESVKTLKSGGTIVYPTETAYGLGVDFFNPLAIKKIYQIKGRNYHKPLSVLVSDLKMAKELVKFNEISLNLAKKYWPGALTLVLKIPNSNKQETKKIQNPITNNQTLGLRISSNKLATVIVKKFGKPITATSANVSGKGECYSATEVVNQFKNKKHRPDLIIDAGRLPKRKVSTIVNCTDDKVVVLRQGGVKIKIKCYR